jgi:hypothetical protein
VTARILSQHGNVIAADFRPRTSLDLTITIKSETLYADGLIMLTRTTAYFGDKPFMVTHFAGDLSTGKVISI